MCRSNKMLRKIRKIYERGTKPLRYDRPEALTAIRLKLMWRSLMQ